LNYSELQELWKKEKSTSSLCIIPKDLYISLDGLLAKYSKEVHSSTNPQLAKEILDRIMFIRKDIMQLRIVKIVNSVLFGTFFDEDALTWGERRITKNLRHSIETIGVEKPNILDTREVSPEVDQLDNPENEIDPYRKLQVDIASELDYSVIRVLDDIEAFCGLDNIEYGPMKKMDIVNLPTMNANALITRGVARLIEVSKNQNHGE
jgi:DNA replication initiation complex subunit (GINS family)